MSETPVPLHSVFPVDGMPSCAECSGYMAGVYKVASASTALGAAAAASVDWQGAAAALFESPDSLTIAGWTVLLSPIIIGVLVAEYVYLLSNWLAKLAVAGNAMLGGLSLACLFHLGNRDSASLALVALACGFAAAALLIRLYRRNLASTELAAAVFVPGTMAAMAISFFAAADIGAMLAFMVWMAMLTVAATPALERLHRKQALLARREPVAAAALLLAMEIAIRPLLVLRAIIGIRRPDERL
jgi:hypothetical protein